MKNGDFPAIPLSGDAYTDFAAYLEAKDKYGYNPECQGLTKREHFAGLAMQAFVTNPDPQIKSYDEIAFESVEIANALLKALGE